MFAWIFHRVSGVLLILLLLLQVFTGYFQANPTVSEDVQESAFELHKQVYLNSFLVFLFIFHSLYGIRTILMDLGVRKEKLLFWAFTGLGLLLFAAFVAIFLPLVKA